MRKGTGTGITKRTKRKLSYFFQRDSQLKSIKISFIFSFVDELLRIKSVGLYIYIILTNSDM